MDCPFCMERATLSVETLAAIAADAPTLTLRDLVAVLNRVAGASETALPADAHSIVFRSREPSPEAEAKNDEEHSAPLPGRVDVREPARGETQASLSSADEAQPTSPPEPKAETAARVKPEGACVPMSDTSWPRTGLRDVWTPEEDRLTLDMADKGFGYEDIAVRVGRSRGAVGVRLVKLRKDQAAEKTRPAPAPSAAGRPSAPALPIKPAPAKPVTPPTAPVLKPLSEQRIDAAMLHAMGVIEDGLSFPAMEAFTLMNRLSQGEPSASIAEGLGIALPDFGKRMRALIPSDLKDPRGAISIDGSPILLEALRRLAFDKDE